MFSRPGVYTSPATFVDGFKTALWVGAGFSAVGVVAALLGVTRRPAAAEVPLPSSAERVFANAGD